MVCAPRIYSNGQCYSNGYSNRQCYAYQMCSASIPCPPAFFRYIRLKYDNGTITSQSIISAFAPNDTLTITAEKGLYLNECFDIGIEQKHLDVISDASNIIFGCDISACNANFSNGQHCTTSPNYRWRGLAASGKTTSTTSDDFLYS